MTVLKAPGRAGLCILAAAFGCGFLRMAGAVRESAAEQYLAASGSAQAEAEGRLKSVTAKNGTSTFILQDVTFSVKQGPESVGKAPARFYGGLTVTAKSDKMAAGDNPCPGMRVRAFGRAELFSQARNPGEFDYRLYYRAQKQQIRLKASRIEFAGQGTPLAALVQKVRNYASETIKIMCEKEDAGIYQAVLLGDKSELDEELRELYQKNGIAHLLAVSGLHVSLIGMAVFSFSRRVMGGFGKAALVSGAVVLFYGCLTGFSSSVSRALIMILCSFLASYLGRTYDLLSAMALSLALLSLDSPLLLLTSGFQLSYGAVSAIGVSGLMERRGEPRLCSAIRPGVMIQLFTYPIILYHFFEFPVYGFFLNFLVIPLMTYVVGSGIACIALHRAGIDLAAQGALGIGHYILAFYRFLCGQMERLPFHCLTAGRPEVWKLFLYVFILAALLIWMARGKSEIRHTEKKAGLIAIGVLLFALLAVHPVKNFELVFLDVGQGDSIFLQTSRVKVLVDSGSTQLKDVGRDRLVPFLKSRGVRELDYVFLTHGDQDHINGIEYLLEGESGIGVKNLVFSCLSGDDKACKRLQNLAAERGTMVHDMKQGDALIEGKLSLTCVYPKPSDIASDKNGQSLILLARYGDFSALLTGDAGQEGERQALQNERGLPENLTLLKAGHHGSKTSTGQALLDKTHPSAAVLSYGQGNSYGHPSGEVVERLLSAHAVIWRTAESGAVMVRTDGKKARVSGFLLESQGENVWTLKSS